VKGAIISTVFSSFLHTISSQGYTHAIVLLRQIIDHLYFTTKGAFLHKSQSLQDEHPLLAKGSSSTNIGFFHVLQAQMRCLVNVQAKSTGTFFRHEKETTVGGKQHLPCRLKNTNITVFYTFLDYGLTVHKETSFSNL